MLPTSAVPSIVGVGLFVSEVVVVIDGVLGAVVSISIIISEDAADSFPAASVAVTVKTLSPSDKVSVNENLPSLSAISVPREVSSLNKVTVVPATAVPSIV